MNPSPHAKHPSLPPAEAATLIELARENLRLLAELVSRYEVGHVTAPVDDRIVRSPPDVVAFLGAELVDLAQEQLRVVLLDTKNRILGTQLIYQGGLNATVVRLADCFREAVARNAAAVIFCHNHPSGDVRTSADDIRLTEEAGKVGKPARDRTPRPCDHRPGGMGQHAPRGMLYPATLTGSRRAGCRTVPAEAIQSQEV